MQEPPLPEDEIQRLDTLHCLALLDTPAEERFDRLTRMARRMFNVPIALVSLVDADRQWFKSCFGLPVSQTPRNISFCGHAILGNEPFIVPDATLDSRFADNPLVTGEPGIRFYAGYPLRVSNGCKLGTLCIIDHRPRELSPDDLDLFQDLATIAVRELEALELATLDELTLVSNRRGFMMLAQKSLNLAHRQGQAATLLFMDLDGFKKINDQFGHSEGDVALCAFANLMRAEFRSADIFARLGGDEFVVLLPGSNSAEPVVDRFRAHLQQYNQKTNRGYQISFSEGAVYYDPATPPDLDAMLLQADQLMYQRKRMFHPPKTP